MAWSRLMDSGRARNQVVPLWIYAVKLKRQKPHVSSNFHPNKGRVLGVWDPNLAEKSEATFLDGLGGKIDSWN